MCSTSQRELGHLPSPPSYFEEMRTITEVERSYPHRQDGKFRRVCNVGFIIEGDETASSSVEWNSICSAREHALRVFCRIGYLRVLR